MVLKYPSKSKLTINIANRASLLKFTQTLGISVTEFKVIYIFQY